MTPFDRFEKYNDRLEKSPPSISSDDLAKVGRSTSLALYSFMLRLRICEESLIEEYHAADEIRCPVHFCVGQEALPAALSLLLQTEDSLFSHHRSHGYYLAKVGRLEGLFAELYGKQNGASGGRAGSQDLSEVDHRFHAGAILAGMLPIAVGSALGMRLKGKNTCAISISGDGAADEGVYWESLNYAATKKLPVLFICENNFYSTFSPQSRRSALCNIAERAHAFGVPAKTLDGNDPIAAYLELREAIREVRSADGPRFIEAFTYRWNGHVGPEDDDWNGYRPAAELEHWKARCPIAVLGARLRSRHWLTDAEDEAFRSAASREVSAAFRFAKESPFPAAEALDQSNRLHVTPLADQLLREQP